MKVHFNSNPMALATSASASTEDRECSAALAAAAAAAGSITIFMEHNSALIHTKSKTSEILGCFQALAQKPSGMLRYDMDHASAALSYFLAEGAMWVTGQKVKIRDICKS